MKHIIIFLSIIAFGCKLKDPEVQNRKSHPSHKYTYVEKDSSDFKYYELDYVPVYSEIYFQDGSRKFQLTTTVSIRNTSMHDTAYILSAVYYDTYGKKINNYTTSTILLSPLESIEFVVAELENLGGVGANFMIEWAAPQYSNQLLIQSVMIGTYSQLGVSFLSEAKVIERHQKE